MTREETKQKWKEEYDKECPILFIRDCKIVGMSEQEIVDGCVYLFEDHKICRARQRPCAGFTYGYEISFCPTNLGVVYTVRCTACNCSQDVSDYNW